MDGVTGDICPAGFYCPEGTADPIGCPAGYFTNATGNAIFGDCNPCSPGYYCGGIGLSEPTAMCDPGFYCPGGQNVSRPDEYRCSPGHYCESGSVEETSCPAGEYQNEWGKATCKVCTAGYYCDATLQNDTFCSHGVQNPQPCPTGHYCPSGTQYAIQYGCPNGTYSDLTHLTAASDCTPCSGGYYCGQEGLSAPTGECTAGYYCTSGASISTPTDGITGDICSRGAYCPAGSNATSLCPPGTYNPTEGLRSEDECLSCTPGEYCLQYGMDVTAGNCSARYYCSGNSSTPTPTDGFTGDVCPVGHYCPTGANQPIPCEPGTYTDTTLNEECLQCTPGHYCITGSNPEDCPAGFFCPEGTGHIWQSCPLGTFSSQTGLANVTQCSLCLAGYYCSQLNATSVTGPCDPGYYCKSGSDSPTPGLLSSGDADICPAGYFCEQATGDPEPCPPSTFNNRTGITSESECMQCLEGYYCDVPGLDFPTGPCDPGFYCTLGSNSSHPSQTSAAGGPCPAGSFCESGSSMPILCVAGEYNPIEAQDACLDCPAGYYCEEGSVNITECPSGHFCPQNTEFAEQNPCNNGTYNNRTKGENVDDCELCPPGMFCPYRGMSLPASYCAPGWYCTLGAWKDKPTTLGNDTGEDCHCPAQSTGGMCEAGTFCPPGASSPVPCTPGYYCLVDELETESGLCMSGYYCNGSTILPNPVNETTGDICPKGHYCPEGSAYPTACEPGTFSDSFSNHYKNDCIPCTAGMYCTGWGRDLPNGDCDEGWFCPEGSTAAQPVGNECLAGHECPVGSPDETPCLSGYYQPLTGQGECIECPAGMYCDQNEAIEEEQSGVGEASHGVVTPKDCPAGFYCLNGTQTARQFPCPVGTYSNTTNLESEAECRACPAGHYCEAENITQPTDVCTAGYYCVLYASTPTPDPANVTGGPCPQGTFCEAGSEWYTPCPKGTFGDRDKLPSEADCTDCYPGKYCMQSGLTEPNGSCLAGYYCQLRAIDPNPSNESYGDICPSGYYCPEGSPDPIDCDSGTYQPYTLRTNESDCLQCSPGKFCNGTGLSAESGFCYEGFYCTGGASSPAPRDGVTGDICPAGSYCEEGSPGHTFCPNGTFMNHTMASACYDCPEGYYCVNRDKADACPPGYYCPAKTGADLRLCPSGTYNPIYGIYEESQCLQCDGGMYCELPGSANVTGECTAGYYCRYGVNMAEPNGGHTGDGDICPPGSYCPKGSPDPIGCAKGSYNELPGQSVCQQCPAGYYCMENATTYTETICPTGYYCPPGTTYDMEYPCPMGTYNPVNGSDSLDDCLSCPPGEYCEADGLELPTGNCSEGWYCTGGSYMDKPLPFSNASDISECTCPLVNYTGGKCWPGTYCPSGSPYPVECTEGWYCREYGRFEPNGLCDPGYFCDGGESEPDPAYGSCPPGSYCETGSVTPTACPAGRFSNTSRNIQLSDCIDCTAGKYCEGNSNTEPTDDCAAGYYCPAGQSSPTPSEYNCTIGHYCPIGSPLPVPCSSGEYQDEIQQPTCKVCPAGYYCDAVEAATLYGVPSHGVVIPVDCVAGYYCPSGTESEHQYPCLEGYYSNSTNLERHAQCQPCPGGTYCDGQGLVEYADFCDAGFVCVSAANNSRPTDGVTGYECLPGYYCPKGSDQGTKCPVGTFSNTTGLENVTECEQCTPGFYCQTEGLTEPSDPCLAKYYCTLGAIDPNPTGEIYGDTCPAGYYCPEGTSDPVECPIGTFLPYDGQDELSDCIDCSGGYYCELKGQTNVTAMCSEGYYCVSGANTSTPLDGITGDECPPGSYCEEGSSLPSPCNDGYYMNHTRASACDICPSRYYCVNKDRVDPCPKGHYCPVGTGFGWESCPLGTYGPVEMLEAASECTQCDPGHYCNEVASINVTGPCSEGFYCELGVDTPAPYNNNTGFGGPCLEGTFCPEGTGYPIGCPPGTYNDLIIQAECTACPAGYYCLANSTTYLDTPCWKGFYCLQSTEYPAQYACPAGTYNNRSVANNAYDCLPCPAGKYCEGDGLDVPSGDCAPGWFCSRGAYTSKPHPYVNTSDSYSVSDCPIYSLNETGGICSPGTYCPEGSDQPTPCPAGQYCGLSGLDTPSGPCLAGFFCNGSSVVSDPIQCSPGYYCPEGTAVEEPCIPGTYSGRDGNVNITDCEACTPGYYCEEYRLATPNGPCEAGYYCPGGQDTSQPTDLACSPGHFCVEGSWNQTGCPSGYYQPHWKRSTCDKCPQGFYCKAFGDYEDLDAENMTLAGNFSGRYRSYRGVSVPTICPEGSYCEEGTRHETEYLCPEGTYSNVTGLSSSNQCTPCEPGMYCQGEGNIEPNGECSPGYYCTRSAYNSTPSDGTTGNICPAGKYCESGSITGVGCPIGTFSNQLGLQSDSECSDCTPGYYCGQSGLTKESGLCWAGFYCTSGAEDPAPVLQTYGDVCFAGYYCPNGTDYPNPCPAGTFLYTDGMGDINDCTPCSAGYYCESAGQTNVTGPCQEGFYCIRGANTSAPLDGNTGDICWDGHYCEEGSPWPTSCGNGTFMNHTGAAACDICPEGYYCIYGDRATPCPQGYYCPEGTGYDYQPCPTGTYGATKGLIQEPDCTPCTGGRYCSTPGSPTTDGPCSAGHYCELGVDTNTPTDSDGHKGVGGVCPAGSYCPSNTPTPIPCPAGSYTNIPQQSGCGQCPAGFYCSGNTSDPYSYPCPVGHYCPRGTEYGEEYPCPEGTYNSLDNQQNSTSCELCPAGQYCEGEGLFEPSGNCSAGWFCTGGSWNAKPLPLGNATDLSMCTCPNVDYTGNRCPPGYFCPEASTHALDCTPGWYCEDYELSLPTAECTAGYYCPGGNSRPDPPTTECPVGHYCELGTAVPTACPNGTYSNTTRNTELANCLSCTPGMYCEGEHLSEPTGPCDPGYYCPAGQSTKTPTLYECPQGFYCPQGSADPLICPRGEFQPEDREATCQPCPTGFYCDPYEFGNVTGIIVPMDCIPGHYCPQGTEYAEQNKCEVGTFSNMTNLASQSECTNCTGGYYCDAAGLTEPTGECLAGYYCAERAETSAPTDGATGNICPLGRYCEIGSVAGVHCPAGRYGNTTGLKAEAECTLCDPGYYCPTIGLTQPHDECVAGHYCELGATSSNPTAEVYGYLCPFGTYCPEGTPTPVDCDRGYYQPLKGQDQSNDCIPCDGGSYCLTSGQANITGLCDEGFYCSGAAYDPSPTDGSTGDVCPIGHYCPIGTEIPIPCSNGTYMNVTNAAECLECPEGYYCIRGDYPIACEAGYYCPPGTAYDLEPCPPGTFGPIEGLARSDQCTECSGGSYCAIPGLDVVSDDCDAGYYCVHGVNVSAPDNNDYTGEGGLCPAGFECPKGSTHPQPCLPGTFSLQEGRDQCETCPSGKYCVNMTVTPIDCPAGHYCPDGTEYADQYPCPEGTYNNATGQHNDTSCQLCPPGLYCEGSGLVYPSGLCDAGFYCSGGSDMNRPFDVGEIAPLPTPVSYVYPNDTCHPLYDCVCPGFILSVGGLCPPGYYCPIGSDNPTPCTPGMYCQTPGLAYPTGDCYAGYYCNDTSSSPDQHVCIPGHYCPIGTDVPEKCPPGSYSGVYGNENVTDCIECTPGKYCEGFGNTAPDNDCDPGYYCPGGQTSKAPVDNLCPSGFYCPRGSWEPLTCTNGTFQPHSGQSECGQCPAGFYCDPLNGTISNPCPQGYYCPPGTAIGDAKACPAGTYGADFYLWHIDNCTSCTAGYYCETPALIEPTEECYAGYYCTGGASTPTPFDEGVDPLNNSSFTGNDICPRGYYCTNGTVYPEPCPVGTFSVNTKVTAPEDCEDCRPGRYCNIQGFVKVDDAPLCYPGYVCTGGSTTPTPTDPTMGYICPAGYYCPAGAIFHLGCPVGTYNPNEGQGNCTVCPDGFMCNVMNMTTPEPCMSGHYCVEGIASPVPCPEGTFNNVTQLSSEDQCADCSPGRYCSGVGNSYPSGPCTAGYYCEGGAKSSVPTPTVDYPNNGICPVGHYCDEGTPAPEQCHPGTIRNTTGATGINDCEPCPGGYYCSGYGKTEATGLCDAGFYCPSNHSTTSATPADLKCPRGHYCLEGTAEPYPCETGTYQPNEGKSSCIPCEAGYYCRSALNPDPVLCPPYHYCPEGTMYPIPCPNGTFTYDNTTGLKADFECQECLSGLYCRGGYIAGPCAAGYFCLAGSEDYTPAGDPPSGNPDQDPCDPGTVCAGPCPSGHYCPEGIDDPVACPNHTLRTTVGGSQLSDCAPCPAGSHCIEGDPTAYNCPVGYYCEEGTEPTECHFYTYRDDPGAASNGDCYPCQPGYWCNDTGLVTYTQNPCPVGHYCEAATPFPEPCTGGRMSPTTGRVSNEDCPLCAAGYYCPNDTINVYGIPCRPTYECPEGASFEVVCRPGAYCEGVTGVPPDCPGGYYCPLGSSSYTRCFYPKYCPVGSEVPIECPLGYMALHHQTLRVDVISSCDICPAGTYGNHTERYECALCPEGYYCPEGTGDPRDYPCPVGYYCPLGSGSPTPCPPGKYGQILKAKADSDCSDCPENTYNELLGQKACRPCGSSAIATPGSSICACVGKNRAFQTSNGACVCQSGYLYYDEIDSKQSDGNSASDCQQLVDTRCDLTQARSASARMCVDPNNYDCTNACGVTGGSFNVGLGRCQCTSYVSSQEICDLACLDTKPTVGGTLNAAAQLQMVTEDPVTGTSTTETVPNTVGPSQHTSGTKTTHIVSFTPGEVQGHIITDPSQTSLVQFPITASGNAGVFNLRRRLLMTTVVPTNSSLTNVDVPYIPNPLICLEIEDMVVFRVYINEPDRSLSNFPIYVKDHLFNSNPSFDYGAFTELKFLVEETNLTIWNFAHVFTEAGKYVFADSQEPDREVIVTVEPTGSSCDDSQTRMQPSSPINLVDSGVNKQDTPNEEPDWGLIIGMLAFLAACILMVIVAVIVWRPRNAGIYPMKMWKPKYRSLGAPPQIPPYLQFCDYDREEVIAPRGVPEGAESDMALKSGANGELEEFNVRTFYDKLEDQSLFLSSQLAKHQEELRNFYERISKQNDGLKNMLSNLDLSKLEEMERQRRKQAWGDGAESSGAGTTVINTSIAGSNVTRQFNLIGGNSRDQELMQALQMLLERINTGKIPITAELLRQAGLGSTTFNIHGKQVTSLSAKSDLPRRHSAEKMQLEKELQDEEDKELNKLLQEHESKRQETLQKLSTKLAGQLEGDLSQSEIDRIMAEHEKEVATVLGRLDSQKQRQLHDLRDRLAQRRKQREKSLREKHIQEAEEAGIPLPEEKKLDPDNQLQLHQFTLDTLYAEESAALAKAQSQHDSEAAKEQQFKLSDNFSNTLESLERTGVITDETKEALVAEQKQVEKTALDRLEKRRAMQMATLKDRMAKKKRKRMRDLKTKHDSELDKLGPNSDSKAVTERQHKELEALEAEMDSEEALNEKDIKKAIDEEKTKELQDSHRGLLRRMSKDFGIDPVLQQQLLDQYRRDAENLDFELSTQKERQEAELKAKLRARRERKQKEAARQSEEETRKRLSEAEELQTSQLQSTDLTSGLKSDMNLHDMSVEEQAVVREHERVQEDLHKRHAQESEDLVGKLEKDNSQKEMADAKKFNSEREKLIREKKNKQAAELAARKDLSEDEVARLLEAHARELEELEDRLDNERARQQLAVRDKLLERKKRLQSEQKRKQEVEMAQELLAQKKELADVRSKLVKEEERKAITEGIQEHGVENTEKVVKAVLEKRHAQEVADLDAQFAAERQVAIEDKLSKLHDKYDKERDSMLSRHDEEMNKLLQQNLPAEQLQQKKAELLNKQQLELAELEQRLASERRQKEQEAIQDWELRYARAKLDLKEKHYQEFAEALREFLADKNNQSAEEAMQAAQNLEDVKQRLQRDRHDQEEQLKKEASEFERREKERMKKEIDAYEQQLDEESKKEKHRTEKSILALNKRKEELLKEKQQKLKEQMEALQAQGGSPDEQKRIMEEHEKEVAKLTNKMDADRLRMQSSLQERLRKRREEKQKAKHRNLEDDMADRLEVHKEKQQFEEERLKAEEIQRLKETVDIDSFGGEAARYEHVDQKTSGLVSTDNVVTSGEMPASYNMAAPLSDKELTALLMASPLYKKLEELRDLVSKGFKAPPAVGEGDHYLDDRDADWSTDDKLHPVDLNQLSARNLVVYKFACFVVEMVATHCQHKPVTLLLADKIAANDELLANPYRHSYHYDDSNRILYMRLARLDHVGEFLLVLVHALAHVKSGDMRDDSQPEFTRQFHKALSVVCHDLFFARYRRTSALLSTQTKAKNQQVQEEQTSRALLEALFGDSHTDIDKHNVVDEILDLKLLRGTDKDGVHFDKEVMDERLAKFSKFTVKSELQNFLGRTEDKLVLARQHGMSDDVDQRLQQLKGSQTAERQLPKLPSKSPLLDKLPAELSGTALWHKSTQDAMKATPKPEKTELQDRIDNLSADFSKTSVELCEAKEHARNLQEELTSQSESLNTATSAEGRMQKATLIKDTTTKLNNIQENITALTMKKDTILKNLEQLKSQL
ncbi:uncharacterized protein LOC144439946 [Glandiceps talaboti]